MQRKSISVNVAAMRETPSCAIRSLPFQGRGALGYIAQARAIPRLPQSLFGAAT